MKDFDCKQCAASARQGQALTNFFKKFFRKGKVRTDSATVVSLRMASARFPTAGSTWDCLAVFRLSDGSEPELVVPEAQFRDLKEGRTGTLTWEGETFLRFEIE